MRIRYLLPALVAAASLVAACGEVARLPVEAGMGPRPELPAPNTTLIPTVNTARAVGWSETGLPTPASGLAVTAYARGLDHPRWLYVLPNGDVLVAETNAPPEPPEMSGGLKDWAAGIVMKRAGARTPSANRITLLRGLTPDGAAQTRSVFLEGLNSPFGMALVGDQLYVANADAVLRFPYQAGQTRIDAPGVKVTDLPAGRNHHWTKNLIASADGAKLYATVGSNSNVAENGMAEEEGRAAIWEIDVASGAKRLYASGLRNPVGMAWGPDGKTLWTAVNERDELGSDLVPDYMTSVRDGGFYGWPYSYFGQHVDTRVKPPRPDLVAQAIVPDYALGPHTASLGLAWSGGATLPAPFTHGMFVGQHGSWNRDPRSGYKVIFVPFTGNRADGQARDVLTGFLDADGQARGRPVGVAVDGRGGLLVADDVSNVIWRVTAQPAAR
ncbi:PQQ-dependent sugar dehydrogenase [Achromobacter xylosoxidans]|uniref:PQQ-dependent sugar dehydrogenase n=1 Tax=Alcaligenes xylosoxydans xylosoxydans TaxID=85698 RepID=UPI0006C2D2B1|nr:sorbosone dehydrogenase family protein [Achromobacter xylosoxidans]CUJ47037.1 putative membrane-bound dehydrogenase domain [Achromobacter xylosoxidans]